jgi:hypothetical protein
MKYMIEQLIAVGLIPDVCMKAGNKWLQIIMDSLKKQAGCSRTVMREEQRILNTARGICVLDAIVSTFCAEGSARFRPTRKDDSFKFKHFLCVAPALVCRREHVFYAVSLLAEAIIPQDVNLVCSEFGRIRGLGRLNSVAAERPHGFNIAPAFEHNLSEYGRQHYAAFRGRRSEICQEISNGMSQPRLCTVAIQDALLHMENTMYEVYQRRPDGRVDGVWNDDEYRERAEAYRQAVEHNEKNQQNQKFVPMRVIPPGDPPTEIRLLTPIENLPMVSVKGAAFVTSDQRQGRIEYLCIAQDLLCGTARDLKGMLIESFSKSVTENAILPEKILLSLPYTSHRTRSLMPQFHEALLVEPPRGEQRQHKMSSYARYAVIPRRLHNFRMRNFNRLDFTDMAMRYSSGQPLTRHQIAHENEPAVMLFDQEDLEIACFREHAMTSCGHTSWNPNADYLPHVKDRKIWNVYRKRVKSKDGSHYVYRDPSGDPQFDVYQADYPAAFAEMKHLMAKKQQEHEDSADVVSSVNFAVTGCLSRSNHANGQLRLTIAPYKALAPPSTDLDDCDLYSPAAHLHLHNARKAKRPATAPLMQRNNGLPCYGGDDDGGYLERAQSAPLLMDVTDDTTISSNIGTWTPAEYNYNAHSDGSSFNEYDSASGSSSTGPSTPNRSLSRSLARKCTVEDGSTKKHRRHRHRSNRRCDVIELSNTVPQQDFLDCMHSESMDADDRQPAPPMTPLNDRIHITQPSPMRMGLFDKAIHYDEYYFDNRQTMIEEQVVD